MSENAGGGRRIDIETLRRSIPFFRSDYQCGFNANADVLQAHNAGTGAKYTRPRRPVELAYYETFATQSEAMRREAEIKRLSRAEKLALIRRGGAE